ncbi:MAG TPA: DUF2807 domain-containing protein [Allosphingosinicella sp.]|nr:DUF2807 domain-containing protein [Allosphingosinicella sp.]
MNRKRWLAAALLAGAAPATAQEMVPLPKFKSIELNGGGSVLLRHGPVQRVTIRSGSTQFTEMRVSGRDRRLVIDACNARCPRRYDLKIEIVTPEVEAVSVNGGGEIAAAGGFPRQASVAAAVHGGGEIDLRALPVREAAAAVDGGGRLLVRPDESLAAAVNGGGEILYWGDPEVASSIDGGGVVRKGS